MQTKDESENEQGSQHTERFSGRAQVYDQFRERYDSAIVLPRLREWCGLTSEWLIADVGAGTGMLADVFLANGNRVVAVEPNADMRAMCVDTHANQLLLEVRDGTAEKTGLTDASVAMISIGRALHWFDLPRCMPEFRRVLTPGGWVAAVAFGRMEAGREENDAYEQIMRGPLSEQTTRAGYKAYKDFAGYFADGEYHHEEIDGVMRLDWECLRGLSLSISHAPRETDDAFTDFEKRLRGFFKRFEGNGKVELGTRYWINAGRFAE